MSLLLKLEVQAESSHMKAQSYNRVLEIIEQLVCDSEYMSNIRMI